MSSAGILTRDVVSEKMKAPITRREACGLLYNVYESLGGAETPDRICTFVDTDDEYVRKAYAAGIVSGRTQSLFDPDSNVTREEFSKMIVNTLEAAGFDVDTYYDDAKDILKNYTDADDISEWAYTAMAATARAVSDRNMASMPTETACDWLWRTSCAAKHAPKTIANTMTIKYARDLAAPKR